MANQKKNKYGLWWDPVTTNIDMEMACIKNGGQWIGSMGQTLGEGLFFHYRELQKLLWPEDDHHRWSDLILEEILKNTITAIMGPKDSGKTRCMAKYALTDYFCFPHDTLIIMSSTDVRGLELRVWGDLKGLFQRAKDRFNWLPGHLIDSKHAITTQNIKENEIRDMRKGISCVPTMSAGGNFVGLGKLVGLKQKRRRLLADEFQFMKSGMLESVANMNSGNFKGVFVGNPIGEGDPLDKVAEPKGGWGTEGDITKTSVWDNRFVNGRTINLVGTDSPNFDRSQDPKPLYPYMIHQKSIDAVVSFYGIDSLQYYSQCLGIRRAGINARRVITRQLCKKFGAMHPVVWLTNRRTKIYGCDAAYRGVGGDRCVVGWVEFGQDVTGKVVMRVNPPKIIPVNPGIDQEPEDQIVEFIRTDCEENDVPSTNIFYDATGRGSLGGAFARLYTAGANPIEFGGSPTERPVSLQLKNPEIIRLQKRVGG